MKKTTIFLILGCLIMSSSVFAQKKNAIKVNIFSPFVSTGSFFYERALTDATSAQLGFLYTGFKVEDTKLSGFAITPEFRFYPNKKEELKGFYLAPFIRYQNLKLEAPTYNDNNELVNGRASMSTFGGGLLIGSQFLIAKTVTLDMFIGPSYNAGSVSVETGSESDFSAGAFDGFGVRLGVTVGLAF